MEKEQSSYWKYLKILEKLFFRLSRLNNLKSLCKVTPQFVISTLMYMYRLNK